MNANGRRWRVMGLGLLMLPGLACLAPTGADVAVQRQELRGWLGDYDAGDEARVVHATEHYVELRSTGEHGVIMTGLTVDAGLSNLEPGSEEVFEAGWDADVLGCSGPSDDYWYFDSHAREVHLQVTQLDDATRRLEFRAVWSDGSEVEGAFDFQPGETAR